MITQEELIAVGLEWQKIARQIRDVRTILVLSGRNMEEAKLENDAEHAGQMYLRASKRLEVLLSTESYLRIRLAKARFMARLLGLAIPELEADDAHL